MDEKKSSFYNNKELSWLDFNSRVLEEAFKKENPIMERLNFLAITASNLDEFFMVRIAELMYQINSGYNTPDFSGLTPAQRISKLTDKIHEFVKSQYSCLRNALFPLLKKKGFNFLQMSQMNTKQLNFINNYFDRILFPVLTPLAIDRSRPFPLLANKSLNIVIKLSKNNKAHFAVIQVPSILPRFLKLPGTRENNYVLMEDIILCKLSSFFESKEIRSACTFRITRDADLDIDEEAENLLTEIKKSIKKRKRGKPVRLEITNKCDAKTKKFLVDMLEVEKSEIYKVPGPLDLTFLFKLVNLTESKELRFAPFLPVDPPADFYGFEDIFKAIKEKDRLIHHPYESFDPVIRFIKQAAEDKEVLAIKQTLYRVSGNSPIVAALMRAAENGKQVTVLVELKARFDEENNIIWAKKLEQAGCHVIYGLSGLKTHCKILIVVRKEKDKIRRYLHLGTGNYNESTAKLYTDLGFFTCKESFGIDGSLLFNTLTGYLRPQEYMNLIAAPTGMRNFFKKMIQAEIDNFKNNLPSGIIFKINSLTDPEIINYLYKASKIGVKIKLIIRGMCCLIPGIPQVSENITVTSIVGKFLEHTRIFKFECAGKPKIFMGSADLMPRNLDRRVELLFPIEDPDLKNRVIKILNLTLSDTVNSRIMLPDATYIQAFRKKENNINSQIEFFNLAKKEYLEKKQKFIFF